MTAFPEKLLRGFAPNAEINKKMGHWAFQRKAAMLGESPKGHPFGDR
ncbi:hypothetical protein HGP17_25295 [Rhizobium sp. P38BS-XIX]|nr:hypothetical protein [Rhizobium sp. P38BS-XIX]NLS00155.1 hypothetical protein [Rhizobium sp. P38BS-XIX]